MEEKVHEPVLEVASEKDVESFEYNTAELEDIKSFFVDK